MMSNIIPFPTHRIRSKIDDFDEEAYRDIGDELLTELLTELYYYTPDFDLNDHHIELCFLYESLMSFIFKLNGQPHIMQSAAKAFVELLDEDYEEVQLELDFD
jgi:hypothetical protein